MTEKNTTSPRILRRKQVEEITGLSRSSIYARAKNGTFPAPISLGGDCVGWIESEITDWLNERIALRAQAARNPVSSAVA